MGSSCWGAPQQELMARASSEFPDLRVQYLGALEIADQAWLESPEELYAE
jgi:hypothetical protein